MLKMKLLAEEEELSENEIKEQMENNNYYKFLREKNVQNTMKEMNEKEKKMEEEFGDLLVDYDKENLKLKKSNTLGSGSIGSSVISKDKVSI